MNLYRIWYWSMSDAVNSAEVEAFSIGEAIEKLRNDDRKCFAQFKNAELLKTDAEIEGENNAAK